MQQQASAPETVWVLSAEDSGTRAAVSATSVAAESDHTQWVDFHAAAADLFAVQRVVAAPARCTRLGLRYINELRNERVDGDPRRLAELLNPALIAPALASGRWPGP